MVGGIAFGFMIGFVVCYFFFMQKIAERMAHADKVIVEAWRRDEAEIERLRVGIAEIKALATRPDITPHFPCVRITSKCNELLTKPKKENEQ